MCRSFLTLITLMVGFAINPAQVVSADDSFESITIEALSHKLKQRDKIIFDLQKRVTQLEKNLIRAPSANNTKRGKTITVLPGDDLRIIAKRIYGDDQKWKKIYNANRDKLPNPNNIKKGMVLFIPSDNIILVENQGRPKHKEQEILPKTRINTNNNASKTKQKPADISATKKSTTTAAQTKSTPGQFEVDEDAAERALERTLVQQGALLLRYGELELQPSFTYLRSENNHSIFVTIIDESQESESKYISTRKIRRDILNTNLTIRAGLPFNSQLELSIPYKYVIESKLTELPSSLDINDKKNRDSGLGDIRVGLAKTILREKHWWSDVIARVTWDSASGESDIGGLNNGFNEIIGSLTFLKRQDPLAFFGSVDYQRTFEKQDYRLGDQLDFKIGVSLAASPETSLSFSLSQSFINESESNKIKIQGSDLYIGTFNIGASSVIGRQLFVSLSAGIGLTDDASDYSVGLSLTKRLNWLSYF